MRTTTSNSGKVLDIADYISHTLAFRHSADALFDHINNLKDPKPIINFKGVEFMGASFAHQYITNKTLTKKYIIEINKNSNVVQMFNIVERRRAKARESTREVKVTKEQVEFIREAIRVYKTHPL